MRGVRPMIQFISHYSERYSYLDSIQLALEGGCRWIQLRMKDATDDEVRPIAIKAQQLCRQYGATFIIDDRVALVKELHADGVHLGKNDMPISEARRILGSDFIIGGTANTFEDAKAHYEASADYIGCGPFRFTTTKKKLAPVLGLEGYRSIIHCGYRWHHPGRHPSHPSDRHHRHCPQWHRTACRRPHRRDETHHKHHKS